jgi:hypothetical protein
MCGTGRRQPDRSDPLAPPQRMRPGRTAPPGAAFYPDVPPGPERRARRPRARAGMFHRRAHALGDVRLGEPDNCAAARPKIRCDAPRLHATAAPAHRARRRVLACWSHPLDRSRLRVRVGVAALCGRKQMAHPRRGAGVELPLLKSGEFRYRQLAAPFVPNLPIVDALVLNPPEDGCACSIAPSVSRRQGCASAVHVRLRARPPRSGMMKRPHTQRQPGSRQTRIWPRACGSGSR